jgi:hypothetical protein
MSMPEIVASQATQNSVSGRVLLKESGVGIPNLLVVVFDAAPIKLAGSGNGSADVVGDRLGSVITGPDGSFGPVIYDDIDFRILNADEKRPELHLKVFAPEEPGASPDGLVLFTSVLRRDNGARTEQFIVRLSTTVLEKAGIPPPSEVLDDLESPQNVVGRLNQLVGRQNAIIDGAFAAAKKVVDTHRGRINGFHLTFKPGLLDALSMLPASPLDPDRFVAAGESVFTKAGVAIAKTVEDTVNSDDPVKRAPASGFISLTDDQASKLKPQADADGSVPGDAVSALTQSNGSPARTTFVQALDRLPLCRAGTPELSCASTALDPPPPGNGTPVSPPGTGDTTISMEDMPRFLGRLMEPMTAPEEDLVVGLMPVATRDAVQSNINSLAFDPSPADVPAFHDFNNLQIAFDYVWQEAIDQGVLKLSQNAYETIIGLGGDPAHTDYQGVHPVEALGLEATLVLNAHATPTTVVRDHRGEPPGTRVAPPPPPPPAAGTGFGNGDCVYAANAVVRDHRTVQGDPTTIEDPTVRLPAVLAELNKKITEPYNFTVYAANDKERSVNFGILNTYRQLWTPLAYQAGQLVKSIPLAPKQTQKLVITRKTVKKRAEKEAETNLRVLKEETSQTNRADQEIVNKASNTTGTSVSNELSTGVVTKDTLTTGFKQDSAKSSDDIKKSFHEAVFKSAQEFKHEKITEITTEETQEYESVETTEISNPNDEIAVTFLFYELQRRYRIYERLYRVEPVVLVAQEFPQPSDIDQAWLLRYDWILRRALLDDSFLPALNTLADTAGDEIAIAEMQSNVNQQRCIVQELRQELAIADARTAAFKQLMERTVYQAAGLAGLFGYVEDQSGNVITADAAKKMGDMIFSGDAAQNQSNRQAMQDRIQQAADDARDVNYRLEREVTALNALTETYVKALRDHNNHLTDIARLQVHVKDNIMYYMQAIWANEPPDQRFFRLHNTPVADLAPTARRFHIDFASPLPNTFILPHQTLPRFGGLTAQVYPMQCVTKFDTQLTYKPLSQVADLSTLLGFKGNYAIFPLYQSNPLTDFMMEPYIDRATGQLVDPSDPLNWSLDEFSDYVCCLHKELTDDEFAALKPQLQQLYQTILTNPSRNDDVLVVPTNSLFIEALPATHTLLERFKLDHRMIDVKKAQAEAREKELENIRRAARVLSNERGDPNIDKKILIGGADNPIVVGPAEP